MAASRFQTGSEILRRPSEAVGRAISSGGRQSMTSLTSLTGRIRDAGAGDRLRPSAAGDVLVVATLLEEVEESVIEEVQIGVSGELFFF